MFFESFSNMFSNMDTMSKLLFIVVFGIPMSIFIFRFGKNLGRTISLIADAIKKIQAGKE